MKKISLSVAFLIFGGVYFANAQVGIGTPTPATSSQLDIVASDKGVLIPRVSLTGTTQFGPITGTEVESLLVYNKATAGDAAAIAAGTNVTPGYYYWAANKWNRVINAADLDNAIKPNVGDVIYTEVAGEWVFQYWDGTKYETIKFDDIVKANESKTLLVTTTDKTKQYYISEIYLGANDAPAQGIVDSWTTVPAGVYQIEVVDGVVKNFQTILDGTTTIVKPGGGNYTVEEYIEYISQNSLQEGVAKIVIDNTTGQASFQRWNGTAWVTVLDTAFKDIVSANETKTMVVTYNNKQYYLSEAYIQGGGGVDPTAWTAVPVGAVLIDVVGGVINNFNEFVSNHPVTVGGDTYTTVEKYIEYVSQNAKEGGLTKIVINSTTNQASFERWDATAKTWVAVDNTAFKDIVKANETATKIVKNTSGTAVAGDVEITYDYFNEAQPDVAGVAQATIDVNADVKNLIEGNTEIQNAITKILNQGGNVFFTKTLIAAGTPAGQLEIPANSFYTVENGIKVLINLADLVADLETKTQIKRSEVAVDGTLPAFADSRTAPVAANVKKGEIFYEYNAENNKDFINVTADIISSITNNEEVQNAITKILNQGGNVFFTKTLIAAGTPAGQLEIPANSFYTVENGIKVLINLADLVANLETKTRITRAIDATDKEVIYSYAHEVNKPNASGIATIGTPDVLNVTEDVLYSITNNEDVIEAITNILKKGGNVFFGDHDADVATADVLYTVINGVNTPIDISGTVLQIITNNAGDIKTILGDKINKTTVVKTGDTFNERDVYIYTNTTTIAANSAETTGITIPAGIVPGTIIGIKIINANGISSNVTDIAITGQNITFNVGTGNMYNILGAGTYDVIVEFTE